MNEKRSHLRKAFVSKVTLVTQEGRSCITRSRDLSLNGIFLETTRPYTVGTTGLLVMTISRGGKKEILSTDFKVCRSEIPGVTRKVPGMGIEFTGLDSDGRLLLQEIIDPK
jgi:Tfp pilus assembly protein PilZ